MIPGIAPAISKKKAAGPGGEYSFTMTAGSLAGVVFGYSQDVIGDIDAEPLPNNTLSIFIYDPTGAFLGTVATYISFEGDARALLSGKYIHINGTPYINGFSGWVYISEENATDAYWTSNYPVIEDGLQYFVEIK